MESVPRVVKTAVADRDLNDTTFGSEVAFFDVSAQVQDLSAYSDQQGCFTFKDDILVVVHPSGKVFIAPKTTGRMKLLVALDYQIVSPFTLPKPSLAKFPWEP